MFYASLFSALSNHSVRYAVVGGVAVNLYGVPRMTADVDLVVDLEKENLQRFLDVMLELGFRPRLPVKPEDLLQEEQRQDWIAKRNLHAFTFWNQDRPFEEVDLLLGESANLGVLQRVQMVEAGDLKICVVGIDDLIEMKKRVGRLQDRADIEALRKVKHLE
jgi:hypothetical protein